MRTLPVASDYDIARGVEMFLDPAVLIEGTIALALNCWSQYEDRRMSNAHPDLALKHKHREPKL